MRLAIRVLLVLALPGVVFGFLTRVPPVVFDFDIDWGFTRHGGAGWGDVLGASITAATVVAVAAAVVFLLVKLGIGAERYPTRRPR